jgi:cytochrome b
MTPNTSSAAASTPAVKVWDPFVRIFHWSLVTCIVLNQFVLEAGETAHEWAGYLASTLVLLRLVWGFVGGRHARFADFFPTPQRLTRIFHRSPPRRLFCHFDA